MEASSRKIIMFTTITVMACLFMLSCATTRKPANVDSQAAIEWQLTDQAEITSFTSEMGTFKNDPALTYTVSVKNTTTTPQRYRLNIFLLDQDKAAGHLIPRTGKPPVVNPGETVTVKVPFIKTTTDSKKLLVVLKTMAN
ncbi:MAG: hypothetical protein JXO49_12785 [Deltaproteobacteria bacterium]|nr:hypothetical protein [Candidatus Anaeroferrophillus wilburensis]MBN2890205.1 hypothetical protein [Deltaproteobacteria bacterium]